MGEHSEPLARGPRYTFLRLLGRKSEETTLENYHDGYTFSSGLRVIVYPVSFCVIGLEVSIHSVPVGTHNLLSQRVNETHLGEA